jgi:hypothetical protein
MATEGRRTAAASVIRDIERLIAADPGTPAARGSLAFTLYLYYF